MQLGIENHKLFFFEDSLLKSLQILDSHFEKKNTQNEHIITHFEYIFTCHYCKTVCLAENLNEIKITHYEKVFSHIKQKFSHFEKGLGTIIFTEIHHIKTKPKNNFGNI